MDQLHTQLSSLKCYDGAGYKCGYIIPGHGLKGKQKSLITSEDLSTMYDDYKGKQIRLWVKRLQTRKRPSPSPGVPPSKTRRTSYDSHLSKMAEVEIIIEDLKENHGTKYTPEQLNA